ncbi:MAG TPA: serine protease [Gemmatimonadaceae bacterium]|nr:serine protease [Gemmatimonadaceae bacterium]
MRRPLAALAAALAVASASALAQDSTAATAGVFQRYAPQVVQIRIIELKSGSKSQIGSGFFAAGAPALVTNFHVIAPVVNEPADYRAEWVGRDGAGHPLRVLAVDVVHDLAVVSDDKPAARGFALAAAPVAQGTRLYALGNPSDLGLSIVEGTYNGELQYALYPKMHFTGAINRGMSGGPAITADGRVVGVNVATAGNGIGFLVPASYAAALLARATAPGYAPPKDFQPEIAAQVSAYQAEHFAALLADSTAVVTLGDRTVPTRPASFFRCWGDITKADETRHYDVVSHRCETEDEIFLSEDHSTGSVYLHYWYYSTTELGPSRFAALLQARYGTMSTELDAPETEAGNFHCVTRNVRRPAGERAALTMRVATCLRRYKKLAGLYDVSTHVVVLGGGDHALIATLTVSGVSWENAEALTARFLGRIQ